MMYLKIKELMIQKGMRPSLYKLVNAGIGRNTAKAYYYNTAKAIKLEDLERLCLFFNCTPKEILGVSQNQQFPIAETHPLHKWIDEVIPFPIQALQELNPEEIKKAHEMIWELIRQRKENVL